MVDTTASHPEEACLNPCCGANGQTQNTYGAAGSEEISPQVIAGARGSEPGLERLGAQQLPAEGIQVVTPHSLFGVIMFEAELDGCVHRVCWQSA